MVFPALVQIWFETQRQFSTPDSKAQFSVLDPRPGRLEGSKMFRNPSTRRAFTLIELLVVISIIALLISILIPALGKARKTARLAISASNMASVLKANASYNNDNKGKLPYLPSYSAGQEAWLSQGIKPADVSPRNFAGVFTFSFAGKNCGPDYWSIGRGKTFDMMANVRPLNKYLTAAAIPAPPGPKRWGKASVDADRTATQIPVLKDPSDRVGHQQSYPATNKDNTSCYDDVGTSYQTNLRGWQDLYDKTGDFGGAWEAFCARMQLGDQFSPSLLVFAKDEWGDITLESEDPKTMVKNGYDDYNRSVLGFMDGHAKYTKVRPGNTKDSVINDDYWVTFPDWSKYKY